MFLLISSALVTPPVLGLPSMTERVQQRATKIMKGLEHMWDEEKVRAGTVQLGEGPRGVCTPTSGVYIHW